MCVSCVAVAASRPGSAKSTPGRPPRTPGTPGAGRAHTPFTTACMYRRGSSDDCIVHLFVKTGNREYPSLLEVIVSCPAPWHGHGPTQLQTTNIALPFVQHLPTPDLSNALHLSLCNALYSIVTSCTIQPRTAQRCTILHNTYGSALNQTHCTTSLHVCACVRFGSNGEAHGVVRGHGEPSSARGPRGAPTVFSNCQQPCRLVRIITWIRE
jgi:hypothetical protein